MSRNLNQAFALLLAALLATAVLPLVAAAQRPMDPVYVALDAETYLRLVPLSLYDGYAPLLLRSGPADDAVIDNFVSRHGGVRIDVGPGDVDMLLAAAWPAPEQIVLVPLDIQWSVVGAALAARLDAPLYFERPARTDDQELITFTDPAALYEAYRSSLGDAPGIVLLEDDEFAPVGALIAAYRGAMPTWNRDTIARDRPPVVTWVTAPERVTREQVRALYAACHYDHVQVGYDAHRDIIADLDARRRRAARRPRVRL